MNQKELEAIYLSLQGLLIPEAAVPWVHNLFAENSICHREYENMRDAYERLCTRLGIDVDDEDADLNRIVDSLEKSRSCCARRCSCWEWTIRPGQIPDEPAKTAPEVTPGL